MPQTQHTLVPRDPYIDHLTSSINQKLLRVKAEHSLSALSGAEWRDLALEAQALERARFRSIQHATTERNDILAWTADLFGFISSAGLELEALAQIFGLIALGLGGHQILKKKEEEACR